MEQIRLDLIPGKNPPTCHASQYDVGRTIRLNLVEGGSEYSIPSGTTAEIHIRKPDNNIISAAVTATQGNKYIDIVTAEQWTACAGTNLCEIVLTNGGNVIGTINFILEVEMDPIDGGTASESVIENIQGLVDAAVAQSPLTAEVEDIRTGVDGTVYPSAGDAVRGQVNYLKDTLMTESNNLFDENAFSTTWYNSDGSTTVITYTATSDFINVSPDQPYIASVDGNGIYLITISWFNSNKEFLSRSAPGTGSVKEYTALAPSTAAYAKVGFNFRDIVATVSKQYILERKCEFNSGIAREYYAPKESGIDYYARNEVSATIGVDGEHSTKILDASDWTPLFLSSTNGGPEQSSTRVSSGLFVINDETLINVYANSGFSFRCVFYDTNFAFISTPQAWKTGAQQYAVPINAKYLRFCVKNANDTAPDTSIIGLSFSCIKHYTRKKRSVLSGKKISILGDSISTFAGIGNYATTEHPSYSDGIYTYSGNGCRYPQIGLCENVTDMYWYKLMNHFGMTLGVNESYAGTTITGSDNKAISSLHRINHLGNNGTPDVILVNGGTNDCGKAVTLGTFNTESPINYTDTQIANLDCTTFADAVRAMLIRLLKYYPTSRVVVLLPNYTSTYYTPDELDDYNEVLKEACDYFGVKYMDTRNYGITMYNRANYLGDGLHYNPAGMELLYHSLAEQFDSYFG